MNNVKFELLKLHTLLDADFFMWNRYIHKRDMTAEMIMRIVVLRHWEKKKTTIKKLEYYTGLSINTIRSKLNFLQEQYDCIQKVTYNKDKRNTIVVPTNMGLRSAEIHTARMLKTIMEISPLSNAIISDKAIKHFDKTNTTKHPAFTFDYPDVISYYNNVENTRKEYTQKIHAISDGKRSVQK